VPEDIKEFGHWGEYRDLLKKKIIHPAELFKWMKSCLFTITNMGDICYSVRSRKKVEGTFQYYFKSRDVKKIYETLNTKCLVINPDYGNCVCIDEVHQYINFRTQTLSEAMRCIIHHNMLDTYDDQDFIPYLDMKGFDKPDIDQYTHNIFTGFPLAKLSHNANGLLFEQSLMYKHLKDIVCAREVKCSEYLFNWIAHMIQKPAERPGVNILTYGEQGCGKGTTAQFLEVLVGIQHYMIFNNIDDFVAKHNSDQQGKLLIFLDEVGDNSKGSHKVHNIIKSKTTEKRMKINPKYIAPYMINNYARYISASNFENNLRIERTDRRFLCLEVSSEKLNDISYFKPLYKELNNIEFKKIAFKYFATRDISNFEPSKIPNTKLKNKQKMSQLQTVQFLIDLFNKGLERECYRGEFIENKDESGYDKITIGKSDLYKLYVDWVKEGNDVLRRKTHFSKDLEKMGLSNGQKSYRIKDSCGDNCVVRGYKITAYDLEQKIKKYTKNDDFVLSHFD